MSDRKKRRVRRKKKFLMGVNEYWLIEDTLMPTYAHLVDSYSEKVKNEWKAEVIKVEDPPVFRLVDKECTTDINMVIILLFLVIIKH